MYLKNLFTIKGKRQTVNNFRLALGANQQPEKNGTNSTCLFGIQPFQKRGQLW